VAIDQNCHLICVTGGKGGVGKSVFAANLAFTLLSEMRVPTLLIDADAKSCGDQNIITGLRPNKTLKEVAQFSGGISTQSLKSIVTPHSSGLNFLGAVHSPDEIFDVAAPLFLKQLFTISQHYRFIVADLGTEMGDLQFGLIEDSSSLVMITTPDVLTVNQTRRKLSDLMTATVPSDLFHIVLNKHNKNGLSPNAISQSLRKPILGALPQDELSTFAALQRSMPFVLGQPNAPLTNAYHDLVRKLTGGALQKQKAFLKPKGLAAKASGTSQKPALGSAKSSNPKSSDLDPMIQLKKQIHSELIREMDLKKDLTQTKGDEAKELELKQKTQRVISQLTDKMGKGLSRDERSRVIREVLDEALGLGPLEDLLGDPKVSEIMVNGAYRIYIERAGKLTLSQTTFTSNLQLRNVIERIVTPIGRRIDEKTPYVDARLRDGSRVNAVIEPLAIDGPSLTIRKFPQDRITIEDYYTRFGSMSKTMADFLRICVEQGLNIIISGGTGSGKTTLLNALSGFIPANERIITVEDAAELQLKQEHVVRLETRPANMEGSGEITIRDLIRNSLRMRPDRIVVGECRDGAAMDMLAAMNTGHDGSMTTVHANNPKEAISRLETLCLMAGMDLPVKAIREQIAGAVDLIVQIGRLSDGSRRVKSITEVAGMQGEVITLAEIFRFKEEGFDKDRKIIGQYQAMGLIPTFIEELDRRGVTIPRNLFTSGGDSAQAQQKPRTGSGPTMRPKPQAPKGTTGTSTQPVARKAIIKKSGGGGRSG
jgi:septum site-determining protein MinD